jgi:hypothetical protein
VNLRLTLLSSDQTVTGLVADFARGLGCEVQSEAGDVADSLHIQLEDAGDLLLELLDYVALSTTKAGIDPSEPLCRIVYRRRGASAQVQLDLRISDITLLR